MSPKKHKPSGTTPSLSLGQESVIEDNFTDFPAALTDRIPGFQRNHLPLESGPRPWWASLELVTMTSQIFLPLSDLLPDNTYLTEGPA